MFTILPLVITISAADRLDALANMTPSGMGQADFSCLATASRARLNPPLCMDMGLEWSCVTGHVTWFRCLKVWFVSDVGKP
jgi:hypothetical protein